MNKYAYDMINLLYYKRLFVLAYFIVADAANNEAGTKDNKKYFLPRGEINNYNVLINCI